MDSLLSFLPPDVAEVVRALCALVTAFSLLAAAIKHVMGEPRMDDGTFRRVVFSVLHWIDWLAVNTEPVRSQLQRMDERAFAEVKRRTSPPPLPLLVFAFVTLAPTTACATTNTLQKHAIAAHLTADIIDQAGAIIEHEARVAEESAVAAAVSLPEARARVDEARARFAPIEAAYDAVREAHEYYVDAIAQADRDGHELKPDYLRALGLAWAHLEKLANVLRVKLPRPPDELLTLLGGAQ